MQECPRCGALYCDDHGAERPDDDHRPDDVAPLNRQDRRAGRREQEQRAHAEVRRVEDVAIVNAEDVLGGDRHERAERVGPQKRRTHEDADADARDVGARRMGPFSGAPLSTYPSPPQLRHVRLRTEHHFHRQSGEDGSQEHLQLVHQ